MDTDNGVAPIFHLFTVLGVAKLEMAHLLYRRKKQNNTGQSQLSRFENISFLKKGQSRPLFVYFRLFHMTQFKYKLIKA